MFLKTENPRASTRWKMPGYMITINNPNTKPVFKKGYMKYMVYQLEKGENGTPHYQMYLQTFKRHSYDELRKILDQSKASPQEQRKSADACRKYCMKKETRIEDPIEYGKFSPTVRGTAYEMKPDEIVAEIVKDFQKGATEHELLMKHGIHFSFHYSAFKRHISLIRKINSEQDLTIQLMQIELYPWQKKVKKLIEDQNDRTITWVYDEEGNQGKTILAKKMCHNNPEYLLIENAKKADIALVYDYQKTIIFDLARSTENKINYISIEKLKDGNVFSSKYQSATKYSTSNKVAVFANFIPELQKLSQDRWQIIDLKGFKIWTDDEYHLHLENQIKNRNKPQLIQIVKDQLTKEDVKKIPDWK